MAHLESHCQCNRDKNHAYDVLADDKDLAEHHLAAEPEITLHDSYRLESRHHKCRKEPGENRNQHEHNDAGRNGSRIRYKNYSGTKKILYPALEQQGDQHAGQHANKCEQERFHKVSADNAA